MVAMVPGISKSKCMQVVAVLTVMDCDANAMCLPVCTFLSSNAPMYYHHCISVRT